MIQKKLRNVVVSGFGIDVRKDGDLIKIVENDGKNTLISPKEIEQLIISGDVSITSGAVELALSNMVDLVFVEHRPNFFARIVKEDFNMITELWRAQILMDAGQRMRIAKEILRCAIHNRIEIARSRSANEKDVEQMVGALRSIPSCNTIEGLMGLEGIAARAYFHAISEDLPEELGFDGREKHPPKDPVNSMLSYGYTVLRSRVEFALLCAGLNPYEGIIHSTYRERPALSFDLMEEFRQPIVDRVVLTMIARNEVRAEDFKIGEMCYMSESFKRSFLEALYCRFEDMHVYDGQRMEFLDIIGEQARKLAKAIKQGTQYRGFML